MFFIARLGSFFMSCGCFLIHAFDGKVGDGSKLLADCGQIITLSKTSVCDQI